MSASCDCLRGMTSLTVRLGLGTNTFGRTSDEAASHAVLDAFVEAGGTLVDTADTYGESEAILGRWLAGSGRREQVIVTTKVGNHPEFEGLSTRSVTRGAEASLRRLDIDRIDLYYAHYQDDSTPIEESVQAFDALVRAGKIGRIGLSNFTPRAIAQWLRVSDEGGYAAPIALQPHYSLIHRGTYESEYAALARDAGLEVYPYRALGGGFLTGKYRTELDLEGRARGAGVRGDLTPEGLRLVDLVRDVAEAHDAPTSAVALAWLIHQPTVTAPLASATTPGQLAELVAAEALDLSSEEMAALAVASSRYA
jgi:aryl-alcohol dehydrogenase-like predicted oxidoreductase